MELMACLVVVGRRQGPFELVFMLVPSKGFALFRQQDISGQLRKGLDPYYK